MKIDINKVKQQAFDELMEEKTEEVKNKIKAKMVELQKAKDVVARLESQLDELCDE